MRLEDIKENNQSLNNTLKAIQLENKKLETKKQELKEFEKEILEEKEKQYKEVSKYSTFDTDLIGSFIADLLTRTEKTNYKYTTCTLTEKQYKGYDYVKRNKQYADVDIPVSIITKDTYIPFLNNKLAINDFSYFFKNDDQIIILGKNESTINLYNVDLQLNINSLDNNLKMSKTNENYYALIKEYIDSVVDYRIKYNRTDITSEELQDLLVEITMQEKDLLYINEFTKICEKEIQKTKEKR